AINLSCGYGSKKVFEKISIQCCSGQMIAVLGPNGVGKSTLLRCLAGLLAPMDGVVYIDGRELHKMRSLEIARKLSVVLTDRKVDELLTVFEIVAMGRYPYTDALGNLRDEDIKVVWESLRLVGASDLAHRYFNELSDGEKQKVMLARALAQNPRVIILDEPTSFLDIRNKVEVLHILRRLTRKMGISVIFSTHDADMALKLCDLIVVMERGGNIKFYRSEEVLGQNILKELYGIRECGYNDKLMIFEPMVINSDKPLIHIVSGSTTGVPLFRLFVKNDIPFSVGVLHENDVDYYFATAIGAIVISEKPYTWISQQKIEMALNLIQNVDFVIDSGFPVGEVNKANIDLLNKASSLGKKVISLRPESEGKKLLCGDVIYCSDIPSIIKMLGNPLNSR
ncbi:MAG: ABC transporter ATP-binding protein, partial [Candidatus Bathyarchaeia archaeon]